MMKPRLVVLLLLGLCGCAVGGVDFTQPSSAFGLTGNYVLTIQNAEVCSLPVGRYQWDVVGTAGPSNANAVTMTLPGGDRRIHVTFCGNCEADPREVLGILDTGGPPAGEAPLPGGLRLLAELSLSGTVQAGAGGRGEIAEGTADGTLAISRETDEETDSLGVCQSDVHSWSLRPR